MGGASAPTAGACCPAVAHCWRRGLDGGRSRTRRKYRRGKCERLPTPARPARTGSNHCVGAHWVDRHSPYRQVSSGSTHKVLYDLQEARVALDQCRTVALELYPALVEPVQHLDARDRITHALSSKDRPPASRGTASARTGRCSAFASSDAISFCVTQSGPSSSTTRFPLQSCRSSSAATRPTSAVATIGMALSRGCKKQEMTPCSRARSMSQPTFSMNQAGRRKVTGSGSLESPSSIRVRWLNRFDCSAWAPMVDRQTTLAGRVASSA